LPDLTLDTLHLKLLPKLASFCRAHSRVIFVTTPFLSGTCSPYRAETNWLRFARLSPGETTLAPSDAGPSFGRGQIGFVSHDSLNTRRFTPETPSEIGFVLHVRSSFVRPRPTQPRRELGSFCTFRPPVPAGLPEIGFVLRNWPPRRRPPDTPSCLSLALFRTISIGLECWNSGVVEWWVSRPPANWVRFARLASLARRSPRFPGLPKFGFVSHKMRRLW